MAALSRPTTSGSTTPRGPGREDEFRIWGGGKAPRRRASAVPSCPSVAAVAALRQLATVGEMATVPLRLGLAQGHTVVASRKCQFVLSA